MPNNVLNLLSLGDTFNLPVVNNKKVYIGLVADIERNIDGLDTADNNKNGIRNQVTNNISRYINRNERIPLVESFTREISNDVRFLKRFMSLRIIKSDKSNQMVVVTLEQYEEKMGEMLGDRKVYKTMRENPGPEIYKKLDKYLEKLVKFKFIQQCEKGQLNDPHFCDSRIKGLAKTHKEGNPLRPIIDGRFNPCYSLSKYFAKTLENFRNKHSDFDVKNALEVKEKLEKITGFTGEHVMVSFDAESLLLVQIGEK